MGGGVIGINARDIIENLGSPQRGDLDLLAKARTRADQRQVVALVACRVARAAGSNIGTDVEPQPVANHGRKLRRRRKGGSRAERTEGVRPSAGNNESGHIKMDVIKRPGQRDVHVEGWRNLEGKIHGEAHLPACGTEVAGSAELDAKSTERRGHMA